MDVYDEVVSLVPDPFLQTPESFEAFCWIELVGDVEILVAPNQFRIFLLCNILYVFCQ